MWRALLILMLLVPAPTMRGYGVVATQAANAPTVAEILVEEGRIRVEMEIGEPAAEPVWHALRIRADGRDLDARLIGQSERSRGRRDPITGELPPAREGDTDRVWFVVLEYDMPPRPARIEVAGPRMGFVTYHLGLPVMDTHFLNGPEVLDLNWQNPWSSRFRNPSLRRLSPARVSAYLYVEPYEVRAEIVARPLDLGFMVPDQLTPGQRRALAAEVAEQVRKSLTLIVDGNPVAPELAGSQFLRRRLWTSNIVEDDETLLGVSATLGIIFAYPLEGYPETTALRWNRFEADVQSVTAAVTDQKVSRPATLTPTEPVIEWENLLDGAAAPEMASLRRPPGPMAWLWPFACAAAALLFLFAAGRVALSWKHGQPVPRLVLAVSFLALLGVAVAWNQVRVVRLSETAAREVVHDLLWNVYRAFDYRGEARVYDLLAQSVAGDALEDTYLETRRALELRRQGGARVRVTNVEVQQTELLEATETSFRALSVWDATGTVGHWGHIHERRNRYRAAIRVAALDGAWKITGLEIQSEERQ